MNTFLDIEKQVIERVKFMRSVYDLEESQFERLIDIADVVRAHKNDILVQERTRPEDFFYLIDGLLGAYVHNEETNKHIQVGSVRPGEIVGDMSIALGEERSATIRVLSENALIISFQKSTFTDRQRYPEINDDIHFLFWRDLIESLKWRIDLFEMKYGESARIVDLANQARRIRREVPSVHSFAFDSEATLGLISDQAANIAQILRQCNHLVAEHRATGLTD